MKKFTIALLVLTLCALTTAPPVQAQQNPASIAAPNAGREHLSMDKGWKFAFGHAYDTAKDFGYSSAYFFFAKTGYGDGPAAASFDDRAWRTLNLPHDWAVELPFDKSSNGGHGYKPVGRRFPETSVGWYRKTFDVPQSDLGRRLTVQFDGIFRASEVYLNGFFLGRQPSGYTGSNYDISEYLNYGGKNTLVVRADATIDEGWFYEGAGIYRHVWLNKTAPLHVAPSGTFVSTELSGNRADVTARATLQNDGTSPTTFTVRQVVLDSAGRTMASATTPRQTLQPADSVETSVALRVNNPQLWSLETPTMHRLVTTVLRGTTPVDSYETPFGIRTVRFDANQGFFLNGKHVVLKGTNNHQDFAGVGTAIPDALQEYRIARLKAVGCNAYRTSHHPPTPELLDACDRMGMLVLDEHRMMGTSPEMIEQMKTMIVRDRNHPSVIIWSVGNEEWAIEGTAVGERITPFMQSIAKRLDPTRRSTLASTWFGAGNSKTTDVMGYNYAVHGDSDKYHATFPDRPSMATEETTPRNARGSYFADPARGRPSIFDPTSGQPVNMTFENSFTHWSTRPYIAGVFLWTGFDYRGEVGNGNEIGWQGGILDSVGTPKDGAYYYKSWWTDAPMIHLMPHWNWKGREGQPINVWGFSNCDEVELLLNGKSLGRKTMKRFSHLEWPVNYEPGTLLARGYKGGKEVVTQSVSTAGAASAIGLTPHKSTLKADGEDVSVVAVQIGDAAGKIVPDAENALNFTLQGPGKILAVANGEQGSFEPDQFLPALSTLAVDGWKSAPADKVNPQIAFDFNDSAWSTAFARRGGGNANAAPAAAPVDTTYRGTFEAPALAEGATATFLVRDLGTGQIVYLNGSPILSGVLPRLPGEPLVVDRSRLRAGKNVLAVVATPPVQRGGGGGGGGNAASPVVVRIDTPAPTWKRKAFGGIAYVMVQSLPQSGEITLTATSPGLPDATVKIASQAAVLRPSVPAE